MGGIILHSSHSSPISNLVHLTSSYPSFKCKCAFKTIDIKTTRLTLTLGLLKFWILLKNRNFTTRGLQYYSVLFYKTQKCVYNLLANLKTNITSRITLLSSLLVSKTLFFCLFWMKNYFGGSVGTKSLTIKLRTIAPNNPSSLMLSEIKTLRWSIDVHSERPVF